MLLARERLREGRTPRFLAEVGSQGSQHNFDRKLEGKLLLVATVRGHSGEEVEEGDLPCEVVVACRNHQVHSRDEVGSPLGARSPGVQGVGSKDHSEGVVVVCASGWEVPRRLGEVGSRSQVCHTWEAGEQRECSLESPWVHG